MHRDFCVNAMNPRVDVVLPCLDEVEALPWVLTRLPADMHAIVVDNGSSDGSAQLARSLGAEVVDCDRRGYGAACHAGLEAARAEIVAFCDCDASIDPAAISAMADIVARGRAELVVAQRRASSSKSWPIHARIANHALAWNVRRRTGIPLRDLGPLRVGRRDALLELEIADRRSGYPFETVLRAAAAGWRIVPADVTYTPRVGRSKVTGTARGTLQAIHDMRAAFAQC
jgi:glycosyltransferase involved in cell wall biosynthesis